ncbi:MAG: FKBP-type peptidyl-prolyl cis-trans isomerase [Bacteroidaceae bacterium]|nr:FKBP-type peptidyl-prolyl cis-trans isomerase [Bacteroidaceae bacterium]
MKATARLAVLVLAALVSLNASAARKRSKTKKQKPAAEKVDTVSIDTFSYAMGIAQTNGLQTYLQQRMGVETQYMADFIEGFRQPQLTDDDKRLKARLAGMEIRQQVQGQMLQQLNRQVDDSLDLINAQLLISGFEQALAGTATLNADSAQQITKRQLDYYHRTRMQKKYGNNIAQGEAFLADNAKRDSVQTTPSGLQYKVITAGTGATPAATDRVKVNYEGRLIDGTVFDSSYKRNQPATFACNQVIKGWTEALTMMPVGSKWELYIPQQLGYADREAGKIPPFSTLIFTVELLEIVN